METLEQEVERLRAEVKAYRDRELAELRERALNAERDAAHYREEAYRNADLGRQIHAQALDQISDLRAKLEAVQRLTPDGRKIFGNPSDGSGDGDAREVRR